MADEVSQDNTAPRIFIADLSQSWANMHIKVYIFDTILH